MTGKTAADFESVEGNTSSAYNIGNGGVFYYDYW